MTDVNNNAVDTFVVRGNVCGRSLLAFEQSEAVKGDRIRITDGIESRVVVKKVSVKDFRKCRILK